MVVLSVGVCALRVRVSHAGEGRVSLAGEGRCLEVPICTSRGWGLPKSFGAHQGGSEPDGDVMGWDMLGSSSLGGAFVLFLFLALAVKAMVVIIESSLQQWRKKQIHL
jgi:hypothetical protein